MDNADFLASDIGIAPFYKGRAISKEDIEKLSFEEKKNITYEPALYGQFFLPGTVDRNKLDALGIQYAKTEGGLLIQGIVNANKKKGSIIGSTTNKVNVNGEEKTINQALLDDAVISGKIQTEKWLAGLSGDVDNQNQGNNSIDTSKYNN